MTRPLVQGELSDSINHLGWGTVIQRGDSDLELDAVEHCREMVEKVVSDFEGGFPGGFKTDRQEIKVTPGTIPGLDDDRAIRIAVTTNLVFLN